MRAGRDFKGRLDNAQHKELAAGRWAEMPLALQMLNIGSEISRANRWKSKGNQNQVERAVFRALELKDHLTQFLPKNHLQLYNEEQ